MEQVSIPHSTLRILGLDISSELSPAFFVHRTNNRIFSMEVHDDAAMLSGTSARAYEGCSGSVYYSSGLADMNAEQHHHHRAPSAASPTRYNPPRKRNTMVVADDTAQPFPRRKVSTTTTTRPGSSRGRSTKRFVVTGGVEGDGSDETGAYDRSVLSAPLTREEKDGDEDDRYSREAAFMSSFRDYTGGCAKKAARIQAFLHKVFEYLQSFDIDERTLQAVDAALCLVFRGKTDMRPSARCGGGGGGRVVPAVMGGHKKREEEEEEGRDGASEEEEEEGDTDEGEEQEIIDSNSLVVGNMALFSKNRPFRRKLDAILKLCVDDCP